MPNLVGSNIPGGAPTGVEVPPILVDAFMTGVDAANVPAATMVTGVVTVVVVLTVVVFATGVIVAGTVGSVPVVPAGLVTVGCPMMILGCVVPVRLSCD